MAKFYGIGTGPGDSSLLTVKAVDTLRNIDILYTPEAKKGGDSLALSIVKKYHYLLIIDNNVFCNSIN